MGTKAREGDGMKTTQDNQIDPLGNLGAPIRPAPPAPAPVPVSPGVVRNPDGTFQTKIEPPRVWWTLDNFDA